MKFKDLTPRNEERIVALLLSAEEKTTRNGSPYCYLKLSDGDTTINANMWDTSLSEIKDHERKLCTIYLRVGSYNGAPSYTVAGTIDPPPANAKMSDYVMMVPLDVDKMFNEIIDMLSGITGYAAELALTIFREHHNKLLYWPAAKTVHHDLYGGLLYHTYCMMRMADKVCELRPSLDRKVMIIGAALHDIGKLKELDVQETGTASAYTPDGSLFGHIILGLEMINDACRRNDIPADEESIRHIKHIIASHHGKREYGAAALPLTPEAYAIHMIDMLDSRLYCFDKAYEEIDPGCISANGVFGLDGIHPYKPKC